ncbi:uncharacterized protein LOC111195850 [Astyanax mexicanus]|uniref:uncharacterized protein LOC111195850 n=1 Tax=Astyanax mexicanus TaxID=7994 RepID=UPI0020CB423A|nr:uncharacterized protein LOC111195850 [Astyanax mexicanus]
MQEFRQFWFQARAGSHSIRTSEGILQLLRTSSFSNMSLLNSVKTVVQRPVKINRQSWENFQHGKNNHPSRSEKRPHVLMDGHGDAPALKQARHQLERDTVVSTSRTSGKRKLAETAEDEAPVMKKAQIQLERAPPTVWIIGDSYIRRGEEIARSSLGGDLGVQAEVSWFGWGGLRWRGLVPFFNKSLLGRAAPDVLITHCDGNDIGGMNAGHLSAEMKADLHDLHRRFPHMKIMLSDITPRRQWRSTTHPKRIDAARKWLNSEMADFILGVEGGVIHHPYILFHNPRLFLRDQVPLGNELFLNDLAESLKTFI